MVEVVRGRDGSPPDRDWGAEEREKTNPLREWHFGRRDAEHGMAADDATRAEMETGREKQIYDSWARMMFQRCGRLEQLLVEYCNHYVSISSPENLVRLSPSRFKNDHDMYTCIRVRIYIRLDCRQNRPSAVPIENHSVECRQSKDREPVETDLSRPAWWQRNR